MTAVVIILIVIVALVCCAWSRAQRTRSNFHTICPYCNSMLERDERLDSMSQDGSNGYRCPRCGYVTFFHHTDRP